MGSQFATLPEHFRNHGYLTSAVGFVYHDVDDFKSWSLGHWRPPTSEMLENHGKGPRDGLPGRIRGQWQSPEALNLIRERWERLQAAGFTERDLEDPRVERQARGPAVESADVKDEAYHGGQVASKTIEIIHSLSKDEPFFLAAGFIDTHLPFWAPKRFWDLYDRDSLVMPGFLEPPQGSPEWAMGDSEPAQYYTTHGYERSWTPSVEESLELLHGRFAVLSFFDHLVGRILLALEQAGHAENTMVVLTSDHGFHEGEHGYWGKHNLWDRSLQVPLILHLPGAMEQEERVSGLTEHVDIYPTLCELAGLPLPGEFLQGLSMLHLLSNPRAEGKVAVFAHRKPMWHDRIKAYDIAHSVRTQQYRLTRYLDESGRNLYTELFDYAKDSEERYNFAQDPQYAAVLSDLVELLNVYLLTLHNSCHKPLS